MYVGLIKNNSITQLINVLEFNVQVAVHRDTFL